MLYYNCTLNFNYIVLGIVPEDYYFFSSFLLLIFFLLISLILPYINSTTLDDTAFFTLVVFTNDSQSDTPSIDSYNGHSHSTTEFQSGIYYYHVKTANIGSTNNKVFLGYKRKILWNSRHYNS